VLINGAAFDRLSSLGRRVILTHELVHVATRATGSRSAPTWLEEGFADYVAYQHTQLSAEQIAGDALAGVRAGRMPAQLPATNDFNAAGDEAAAAYGLSWIAVQVIAEKAAGTGRMKDFYRTAAVRNGGSAAVDRAFAALGWPQLTDFLPDWQSQLARLAKG
jgi:hypothetical protein